jgi:DNA polymerase III, subunits gamma and tau
MEKNMHKALYRIYRPTSFIDIVGQEQIISILKNQISEGSVSHAYLFSGGRGTGKTSTAKVFAKAVNCVDPVDQEPCHKCSVCVQGDMDIIEIDAASNNSVDNIRELRENVVYTPSYGKYKVYIIDEVHMLSQGAFNALLKTLEEPPSHVIFILATTEPQKIPATVLSRCQRFDFKKIDKNQIIARMIKILDELGLTYEEEAIELIAQKSDGGMRDALSLLDQAIAYKELTYQKCSSCNRRARL